MITWVTVWVLTVISTEYTNNAPTSYQLTYATQEQCLRQGERIHNKVKSGKYYCDFQQVPMYIPKEYK